MTQDKIGIGVVTCNRPEFYKHCITSILDTHRDVDEIVVVNDGRKQIDTVDQIHYIQNKKNLGVGKSKNKLLKYLINAQCDHIFLVEDDIVFNSTHVLNEYIKLSNKSGVKHLNFCLHGLDNKINGEADPKLIVDYGDDIQMSLYHNVYGALSYYHKDVIDDIGFMDNRYHNAMEHVDHTMQAINAGFHPPFRWFADVKNSDLLIREQDTGHSESTIRKEQEWHENFQRAVALFYDKFNINVCDPRQSVDHKDVVLKYLKTIKSSK